MSSPLYSLKNTKKTPLPSLTGYGNKKRAIPFKHSSPTVASYTEDEERLLNSITGRTSVVSGSLTDRNKLLGGGGRSWQSGGEAYYYGEGGGISSRTEPDNGQRRGLRSFFDYLEVELPELSSLKEENVSGKLISPGSQLQPHRYGLDDAQLLSTMTRRLSQLEEKLKHYTREAVEKERKVSMLEEKVQILQRRNVDLQKIPPREEELQKKCLGLQKQVYEMETFLADYGMIWVGASDDDDESTEDGSKQTKEPPVRSAYWRPSRAVTEQFEINFDKVLASVKELNILAGDGVAEVIRTEGGARLKIPDPVPLTLFENGFIMFEGPFRSYTDATAQQCMCDMMDGFFPSELQPRFPEGVPFDVKDCRDIQYRDPRQRQQFPGEGYVLNDQRTGSHRVVNLNIKSASSRNSKDEKSSNMDLPRMSVEQFVRCLPQSVVKRGRVINIRHDLTEHLKPTAVNQGEGSGGGGMPVDEGTQCELVDTPALNELKQSLNTEDIDRHQSSQSANRKKLATLRVKSEDGLKTYIMKMAFSDTIGNVRQWLNAHRPGHSTGYDILTTFPNRVYADDLYSLVDCGLTPNAALYLRTIRELSTEQPLVAVELDRSHPSSRGSVHSTHSLTEDAR